MGCSTLFHHMLNMFDRNHCFKTSDPATDASRSVRIHDVVAYLASKVVKSMSHNPIGYNTCTNPFLHRIHDNKVVDMLSFPQDRFADSLQPIYAIDVNRDSPVKAIGKFNYKWKIFLPLRI